MHAAMRDGMSVAVLGDFAPSLDEGYRNASHYLASALDSHARVTRLDARRLASPGFWRDATRGRPDVLHVVSQPTRRSLAFLALLSAGWSRPRVVLSALRPERLLDPSRPGAGALRLLRLARPRLVLVQDSATAASLDRLGIPTRRLPNGVDLDRFRPVSADERYALRAAFGLDPRRPVVLHVGHLEPARNLLSLRDLPRAGVQVVVAGSVCMGVRRGLIDRLRGVGYHVLEGYQPRVEELYQLADVYVFPPRPGDSLSMPLSVLEAMATDLPVVTTRFAGLTATFPESPCFRYAEPDDVAGRALEVLAARPRCATRALVEPCSWAAVARRLVGYYEEVLG